MACFRKETLAFWFFICLFIDEAAADPGTFTLGDPGEYTTSATSTPTLTGSAVSVSASGDPAIDGVQVFLSQELQTSLKQVLDTGGSDINSDTYNSIQSLIISPSTELESRQLGLLLLLGAALALNLAIVIPYMYHHYPEKIIPQPVVIPGSQYADASSLVSATAIAVATGSSSPTVTITPTPRPTSVSASQALTITTYTTAVGGHASGDVNYMMSPALATRVQEFLDRNDCSNDGSGIARLKERDDSQLGAVACGARELLANMGTNHAFQEAIDFTVVNPLNHIHWIADSINQAMNELIQFAQTNAPELGLPVGFVVVSASTAFAIAYINLNNGHGLGTDNIVPAASLTRSPVTTAASTSTCTTTSVKQCGVACGFQGHLFECNTDCATFTGCGTSSATTTTTTTTAWVPPTGSILYGSGCEPTDYTAVTTFWSAPSGTTKALAPTGTQCFCRCPVGSQVQLMWGTDSAKSLTSWCAAAPITTPSGITRVFPSNNCSPPPAAPTVQPPAVDGNLTCGRFYNSYKTFKRDFALDAIAKFCNDDPSAGPTPTYHVDPDKNEGYKGERFFYADDGTFCLATATISACGYWGCGNCPHSWIVSVRLSVQYSPDQSGCKPKQAFDMPKGDVCVQLYKYIMDNCDVSTRQAKNGGLLRQDTDNGCVEWQIGGI